MPQFAVVTRSYRVLTPSENMIDPKPVIAMRARARGGEKVGCVFDKPKVYIVEADTAQKAMNRVKRFAELREMKLIVHRAIEVCETLTASADLRPKRAS